jgi:hypothetical protein
MATVASVMTTEELLALPDDGMERWLIAGELPVLFDVRQELTAEPHLPGFRVPVRRLFE